MPSRFTKREVQLPYLQFNLDSKVREAWGRYSGGLDGDKINVSWGLTWMKVHGDCKSTANAALRSYTMRGSNRECKVKVEYKGNKMFDYPVQRASITAVEIA